MANAISLSMPRSAEHAHSEHDAMNNVTAASFYVQFNMSQLQHTKMLTCYIHSLLNKMAAQVLE